MKILEVFDLTGRYRAATELADCDHRRVRRYVQLRRAGASPTDRPRRNRAIDEFLHKVEELVERSGGRAPADVVHQRW